MTDPTTNPGTINPSTTHWGTTIGAEQALAEAGTLLRRVWALAPGTGQQYRADIHTTPTGEDPSAVVWLRATSAAAAITQTRAHLAVQPGPDDRYAELWVHTGELADFLIDVHLGQ